MQSQAANIQITPDNFVACECGNIHMLPLYIAGKVESPLVGQPPIISLMGVTTFKCLLCDAQWDINESKNVGEWKQQTFKIY